MNSSGKGYLDDLQKECEEKKGGRCQRLLNQNTKIDRRRFHDINFRALQERGSCLESDEARDVSGVIFPGFLMFTMRRYASEFELFSFRCFPQLELSSNQNLKLDDLSSRN
jgi:hypothetical protein